jgi:uncharacterized paraquat-inducible protein A
MAEMVVVSCPECSKPIKVPAEMEGKKVRCKECKTVFTVQLSGQAKDKAKPVAAKPAPAKKPAPPPPPPKPAAKPGSADEEDEDPNPYKLTYEDLTARCPHCAQELESEDAVICLNCGYNLKTREHVRTKKVEAATGGEIFLWLLPGIISLIFALGFLGFAIWAVIRRVNWEPTADTSKTWINLVNCTVIWIVIITAFALFFLGRIALRRLILQTKPPEKVLTEEGEAE